MARHRCLVSALPTTHEEWEEKWESAVRRERKVKAGERGEAGERGTASSSLSDLSSSASVSVYVDDPTVPLAAALSWNLKVESSAERAHGGVPVAGSPV